MNRYGVFGLALFCLACSKWGSYLIPGPPYICDLVIGALIGSRMLTHASRNRLTFPASRDSTVVIIGGLLLGWTVLRLLAGDISVMSLRDAAPFLYFVLVFLVEPLDDDQARVAAKAMTVLLAFHLVWTTASVIFGGQIPLVPTIPWAPDQNENFTPLGFFTTRPDFDVPVLGMFAAISLHRALSGQRPLLNLIVFYWSLAIIAIGFDTTGGFLAVVFQLGVVAVIAPIRKSTGRPSPTESTRRKLTVILLLLSIPLGVYAVKDNSIVRDAMLSTGLAKPGPFESIRKSLNTAQARQASWDRTIERLGQNPETVAVGVGFGPNYLVDTGANKLLTTVGRESVRSPHNFWLNVWARTGLIGLTIFVVAMLAGFWLCFQVIRSGAVREIDLLAILAMVSLPAAATVGVIFESPFGIIPWIWALGHLSIRAVETGMAAPFNEARSARRMEQRRRGLRTDRASSAAQPRG